MNTDEKKGFFSYSESGVDTEKASGLITKLKDKIRATHNHCEAGKPSGEFGSFAGLFIPDENFYSSRGRIAAATDGVGTKIQLIRKYQYYDEIGYDLVGMCANDLICNGAQPAFFLDYISCGRLSDDWYIPVMHSIADACMAAKTPLLGGETAEHPGVMAEDDFDLAGFCVGFLEEKNALPAKDNINEGDLLMGVPSSGLHSNGFSLVRKILAHIEENPQDADYSIIQNRQWVIENILTGTRLYMDAFDLVNAGIVKALVHITGGGYYENIPRILPEDKSAILNFENVKEQKVYHFLRRFVEPKELYSTFNMGIGLVGVIDPSKKDSFMERYPDAVSIGKITNRQTNGQKVFIEDLDSYHQENK